MSRPKKPEHERYVVKSIRFPPTLWDQLTKEIPAGDRSAFIHEQIAHGLQRLRRHKPKGVAAAAPAEVRSGKQETATAERDRREEPLNGPEEREDRTIWEKIDELVALVPEEEFDRLPADGSEHHDHYIYGLPKRDR